MESFISKGHIRRMTASDSRSTRGLGFLTFVDLGDDGLVGGYLIVNHAARPVEFHCSTPIKPNRAQEILYGPTLLPYLYGEQIGRMLAAQAKPEPSILFTDAERAMAVRDFTNVPVVYVPPLVPGSACQPGPDVAADRDVRPKVVPFQLGEHIVAARADHPGDQSQATRAWHEMGSAWDVHEPFDRIREAIREARRAAA
jgi:hypothetical protein